MMRKTSIAMILLACATSLLVACGGGGSKGSAENRAPVANAGTAQVANVGQLVTLSGAASMDPDGDALPLYQWTQVSGSAVALSNANTFRATFTMPSVASGATLTFSLVVTDSRGLASAPATVTITASNTATVAFSGLVKYERVPFMTAQPYGLNYAGTVMMPARGVVVKALSGSTVLATTVTSDAGAYSFTVPGNTSIVVQVEARLLRDNSQPLPNWNVRVQDGTGGLPPYTFNAVAVNSSNGTQDVNIPVGINASGVATGTRASGPFAILDTIYSALQVVKDVQATVFPPLYIDWGTSDVGAFFTGASGQHIALRSSLSEDTDEFDQAVIAHEFGHYLQNNYGRTDSLGGSHGLGDALDPRTAYDEGFATGFGAIVLNSRLYLDSFVDNGVQTAGGFDVEINPPPSGDASPLGPGCWCSEASVWSLVYDLYDGNVDGTDNVQLPLSAIWAAMTGAHRTTPAMATIFSFLASLKAGQPASAAAIDNLIAAQNITGTGLDAFASTQAPAPNLAPLPVYASISPGTPVILATTDDAGTYNKVGNHRFLRFTPATSGTYTVKLTTSNPNSAGSGATTSDPDFNIYRSGTQVVEGSSEPAASEQQTLAATGGTTYIIDAFDCANGCPPDPQQGVPGDYNLTVTIN
jgi:hypothetical protein